MRAVGRSATAASPPFGTVRRKEQQQQRQDEKKEDRGGGGFNLWATTHKQEKKVYITYTINRSEGGIKLGRRNAGTACTRHGQLSLRRLLSTENNNSNNIQN